MSTRARRDYYEVLGVDRAADRETIRRAFRTLAAEHHPDVSGEPNALDRFREIAEAYEVLSRPETRDRYDRYGFDPRGVGGFDQAPASPRSGLFDDLVEHASRAARRGADIELDMLIEQGEAKHGVTRPLRYGAADSCETCGGVGAAPGTVQVSCSVCDGRGHVREGSASGGLQVRTCERCGGSGRQVLTPCPDCSGAGMTERGRLVRVVVPPGTRTGEQLRLAGQGNTGRNGGEPGDLLVRIVVARPQREPMLMGRLVLAGLACAAVLLVLVLVLR